MCEDLEGFWRDKQENEKLFPLDEIVVSFRCRVVKYSMFLLLARQEIILRRDKQKKQKVLEHRESYDRCDVYELPMLVRCEQNETCGDEENR